MNTKNKTVGIISDTHDHVDNIIKAITIFSLKRVDLVIHAGDFVSPFALAKFKNLTCPFVAVFGNNEGEKVGLKNLIGNDSILQEPPLQYQDNEELFFITHVPFDFSKLAATGIYTAIIFGHTHKPLVEEGKTLIINPGESCGWLEGRSTIALLTLPEKKIEIIDI